MSISTHTRKSVKKNKEYKSEKLIWTDNLKKITICIIFHLKRILILLHIRMYIGIIFCSGMLEYW